MKIERIEPLVVNVSDKTNWFFVRVSADNGFAGIGEASLNGWEAEQLAHLSSIAPRLAGRPADGVAPALAVHAHSPGGLIASSIASALEQAITDLRARARGLPLHSTLGTSLREGIRTYANINRGARDRSPEGIAKAACNAVSTGFRAVKIAPFDGVYFDDPDQAAFRQKRALGIERVLAIRDAVGPAIDIMVDCHWRFDEASTIELLKALAPAKLFWLECPISENPASYAALGRLRNRCLDAGTLLAGAERQIGCVGFAPFIEFRLLDVVMPDIKYAGGYTEMLRIAALCERHGVGFSPHNPTGPICNLASMHLCKAAPAFLTLEHQLAESPLYFDLVGNYRPRPVDGAFVVPDKPGLGVDLDDAVLRAHPYRALAANANLDPKLG